MARSHGKGRTPSAPPPSDPVATIIPWPKLTPAQRLTTLVYQKLQEKRLLAPTFKTASPPTAQPPQGQVVRFDPAFSEKAGLARIRMSLRNFLKQGEQK